MSQGPLTIISSPVPHDELQVGDVVQTNYGNAKVSRVSINGAQINIEVSIQPTKPISYVEWQFDGYIKPEWPLRIGRRLIGIRGQYKNKVFEITKDLSPEVDDDTWVAAPNKYKVEYRGRKNKPRDWHKNKKYKRKSKPYDIFVKKPHKDIFTESEIMKNFRIEPTKAERVLYEKTKV